MIEQNRVNTEELHRCAMLLAERQMPDGWELVASSGSARVALHRENQVFYKEFLPRSPVETLKARLKGSRATRARKHSEALLIAGFDAPQNLAWGKLPGAREYLFTRAVRGQGVDRWIRGALASQGEASLAQRWRFLQELGVFIGRLHASGFTHGDLRTSNVLAHEGIDDFEFSLIDNERNRQQKPAAGKHLLKNLMQLNMHSSLELSRSDRWRFFRAWHSQMRDLSALEAKLIASQAYQWAMQRLRAKDKG